MSGDKARMATHCLRRWRGLHGRFGDLPSRLLLHARLARHESAFTWPVGANPLRPLREGRLNIWAATCCPTQHASLMAHPGGRITIGDRTGVPARVIRTADSSPAASDRGHRVDTHAHAIASEDITARV
jgi:hypothetical protein